MVRREVHFTKGQMQIHGCDEARRGYLIESGGVDSCSISSISTCWPRLRFVTLIALWSLKNM
jgi:hypothetical protein